MTPKYYILVNSKLSVSSSITYIFYVYDKDLGRLVNFYNPFLQNSIFRHEENCILYTPYRLPMKINLSNKLTTSLSLLTICLTNFIYILNCQILMVDTMIELYIQLQSLTSYIFS